MNTSPTPHTNNVDANCTPASEGGERGTPPSTLRQLTRIVAHGTLAQTSRFTHSGIDHNASLAERIQSMARSQMTAQARLMATVAGSNKLICCFLNVGSASRTGSAMAGGVGC